MNIATYHLNFVPLLIIKDEYVSSRAISVLYQDCKIIVSVLQNGDYSVKKKIFIRLINDGRIIESEFKLPVSVHFVNALEIKSEWYHAFEIAPNCSKIYPEQYGIAFDLPDNKQQGKINLSQASNMLYDSIEMHPLYSCEK